MSGPLLLLLIVAAFLAIILIHAGVGATIGALFDKAGRSLSATKKPKATFASSLSVADALDATREAAAAFGADGIQETEPGQLTISLQSGAALKVAVLAQEQGGIKIKVSTARGSVPDDASAKFFGALLAALRRRDSMARQTAK